MISSTDARYKCVNGFILKMIAVITMLIDHIGAVLYPYEMGFRYIGRIAFPIFVFLLVEGFHYTRNVRRYELRLLLFVFLSEIPFDLAFFRTVPDLDHQNVFFTLFLGLLMLDLIQRSSKVRYRRILMAVIVIGFMIAAYFLKTDYDAGGILLIFIFWFFREKWYIKFILLGVVSYFVFGRIEMFSLFACIPIFLYNGKRGFGFMSGLYGSRAKGAAAAFLKYAFYLFYPVHLLILHAIDLSGAL